MSYNFDLGGNVQVNKEKNCKVKNKMEQNVCQNDLNISYRLYCVFEYEMSKSVSYSLEYFLYGAWTTNDVLV